MTKVTYRAVTITFKLSIYYKALVDKNMTFTGNTISVSGKGLAWVNEMSIGRYEFVITISVSGISVRSSPNRYDKGSLQIAN